jgi:hypothetical protein
MNGRRYGTSSWPMGLKTDTIMADKAREERAQGVFSTTGAPIGRRRRRYCPDGTRRAIPSARRPEIVWDPTEHNRTPVGAQCRIGYERFEPKLSGIEPVQINISTSAVVIPLKTGCSRVRKGVFR